MSEEQIQGETDTDRWKSATGKHGKVSAAAIFDDMAASNLSLVKAVRAGMWLMIVCAVLSTLMAAASAWMLHSGQEETRALIRTLCVRN